MFDGEISYLYLLFNLYFEGGDKIKVFWKMIFLLLRLDKSDKAQEYFWEINGIVSLYEIVANSFSAGR